MKILILGGSGMLGHKLVQVLSTVCDVKYTLHGRFEGIKKFGFFRREAAFEKIDAVEFDTVRRVIEKADPDVIINAAGIIKQSPESLDIPRTLTINSILPHQLAKLSKQFEFRLITMSTDCVYAGQQGSYAESDVPDALDLYGQSKHWGEIEQERCLTIRTSIIGRELNSTRGLLEWFISQRGRRVKGYSNAIFSGFPTLIFADIIRDIIEKHHVLSGVFHISSDPISKFELLSKVNSRFNLGVEIDKFEDFVMDRSLDSSKFKELTGFKPQNWDEMIERIASDPTPYDKWKSHAN